MSEAAASPPEEPHDVRPVVRTGASGNRSMWIFAGVLLLGGVLLFNALSVRREELNAPTTGVSDASDALVSAPPPLSLPSGFADRYALERPPDSPLDPNAPRAPAPQPQVITRYIEQPPPIPATGFEQPLFEPRPSVVFDAQFAPAVAATPAGEAKDRVNARRLLNPAQTVPQGVVIAAVLETAIDSTRPGAVRALVSRDVKGFDGSRVLIARGSRLYGEYSAEVGQGQNRALIRWTRLTRPDGVIMDLDSPAADPLGRAGVRGKVDTHFFARFGGAILQSVLDIGVGVATRKATDGVTVALPGSTQNVAQVTPTQITPTLRVKHGASVSVFVARDLDFSSVDR
jgi:type IV secretion system protein VirB10